MNVKKKKLTLAAVGLLVGVAVVFAAAGPPTVRGVQPTEYTGNFVSSGDDQVCFDMSAKGFIGEVTSDMHGFKIDPPVAYNDGNVSTTISSNGKYLDWSSFSNVKVLAFIVKGGPNYNVYDYVPFDYTDDQLLHSPVYKGKIPEISHYNVCYHLTPTGDEGCTRGYWSNHADRWVSVSKNDDFDTVFGVDAFSPDITLGQAINLTGGGINQLVAQATAALLNAYGGVANGASVDDCEVGDTVDYPLTPAQVIAALQAALDEDGDVEGTKDLFDGYNNLGCPLCGTRACNNNPRSPNYNPNACTTP